MDIKSAVVLVTSAGSQLGSTMAMHFASLGATVILCDKNKPQLEETYKRCSALSQKIKHYELEDYSQHNLNLMLDNIEHDYQKAPDVLINSCPATSIPSLIDEQPTEIFIQQLVLMASTLFSFGQVCTERMRRQKIKGVIVNITAFNDRQNDSGVENAKCIIAGFTQSWAKELTPFNIRVGGVVPLISSKHDRQWATIRDELIRNTEYIVANEYFSGRIMSA